MFLYFKKEALNLANFNYFKYIYYYICIYYINTTQYSSAIYIHNSTLKSVPINNIIPIIINRSFKGRRIVNIHYFFAQIQNNRHSNLYCSFMDMKFVSENRREYNSSFKFKCQMCDIVSII